MSCNSYFRELAAGLRGEQVIPTAKAFGLEVPNPELTGDGLMGLGEQWTISPLHMARAYLELYRRRDQPGVRELLAGMAQSAHRGTGAGVGHALEHMDALVKTGTAQGTHIHPAPADGFVIALVPANQPEILRSSSQVAERALTKSRLECSGFFIHAKSHCARLKAKRLSSSQATACLSSSRAHTRPSRASKFQSLACFWNAAAGLFTPLR